MAPGVATWRDRSRGQRRGENRPMHAANAARDARRAVPIAPPTRPARTPRGADRPAHAAGAHVVAGPARCEWPGGRGEAQRGGRALPRGPPVRPPSGVHRSPRSSTCLPERPATSWAAPNASRAPLPVPVHAPLTRHSIPASGAIAGQPVARFRSGTDRAGARGGSGPRGIASPRFLPPRVARGLMGSSRGKGREIRERAEMPPSRRRDAAPPARNEEVQS
jgi:hypothetical protein